VVTKEVDYSTPPPSYTVFNAALGVDLFKNINFNFRINNIFNAEYREYLNRLRFFMPEPGRDFVATIQFKF
jgi:iron complex outermembrane receptor protein